MGVSLQTNGCWFYHQNGWLVKKKFFPFLCSLLFRVIWHNWHLIPSISVEPFSVGLPPSPKISFNISAVSDLVLVINRTAELSLNILMSVHYKVTVMAASAWKPSNVLFSVSVSQLYVYFIKKLYCGTNLIWQDSWPKIASSKFCLLLPYVIL